MVRYASNAISGEIIILGESIDRIGEMVIRKRIYEIIERAQEKDIASKVYDIFMLISIFGSLIPVTIKAPNSAIITLDYVCAYIFIVDYALRWITADFRSGKKLSILKYPFTFMALLDLLAILPTFTIISSAFRVLKIVRVFRVFRVFKTLRYSKNFVLISKVIRKNASMLSSLFMCAIFYIIVSALLIFSIEPESFKDFFEAVYWATTALTTVGYGDIYPVSIAGRWISMISSLFGIAMVALPSGVITAGFMQEINNNNIDEGEN